MRYDISVESKPRKREYILALIAFILAAGYLGKQDYLDDLIVAEKRKQVSACQKAIEQANRHAEVLIAAMNGKYFEDGDIAFKCRPQFYVTRGL